MSPGSRGLAPNTNCRGLQPPLFRSWIWAWDTSAKAQGTSWSTTITLSVLSQSLFQAPVRLSAKPCHQAVLPVCRAGGMGHKGAELVAHLVEGS